MVNYIKLTIVCLVLCVCFCDESN